MLAGDFWELKTAYHKVEKHCIRGFPFNQKPLFAMCVSILDHNSYWCNFTCMLTCIPGGNVHGHIKSDFLLVPQCGMLGACQKLRSTDKSEPVSPHIAPDGKK